MNNKVNGNNHFKRYEKKLVIEGLLKALVFGLIVGFSAGFITALTMYLLLRNGVILASVVILAATVLSTPVFYFWKFRPTKAQLAYRMDRMGLEERIVTMKELGKDDSFMANLQRRDTEEKLKHANVNRLKLRFFVAPFIVLAVCFLFAGGMTTISILEAQDRLPWEPPTQGRAGYVYELVYDAEEGGRVEGETVQRVTFGSSATTVVAVAEDGYFFMEWSDGLKTPERTDINVNQNMELFAIFDSLEDMGGEPSDEETDGPPPDSPPPPMDAETDKPPTGSDDEEKTGGPGGGGKYDPKNQIKDGETYYRPEYAKYLDEAMAILADGGEIPEETRKIIQAYFGIII